MEPLNVLIGPNGSGKSNFLEALALLQAAPGDISEPIANMGGVREWLWKGPEAPDSFTLEAYVGYPPGGSVYHALTLADRNGRPEVTHEQVKPVGMYTDERLARSFNRPPEKEWAEPYRLETSPNVKNENVAGSMLVVGQPDRDACYSGSRVITFTLGGDESEILRDPPQRGRTGRIDQLGRDRTGGRLPAAECADPAVGRPGGTRTWTTRH